MKTTTWITLLASGAILAFAIKHSPSFLNLQVVGWVLIATGALGAYIPRAGSSRQRRSQTARSSEEADAGPASQDGPRLNRILVPGGVITSRLRVTQPAGRQLHDETIED
jgi:hypothetical protein